MRTRQALKQHYAKHEAFFCDRLHMPRWPEDVFVEELCGVIQRSDDPIDVETHEHLHQILLDLDYALNRPYAGTPPWLEELLSLPFIPVRTASHTVELRGLADGPVYLPDLDGEFVELFQDAISIVAFPDDVSDDSIAGVCRVLGSAHVGLQALDTVVQCRFSDVDRSQRAMNAAIASRYASRIPYIRRYSLLFSSLYKMQYTDPLKQVAAYRFQPGPTTADTRVYPPVGERRGLSS